MNNFIVYTFSVPGELLPFYVGKGRPHRPQQHFWPKSLKKQTHFYNKLNYLLAKGIYPEIKIVASSFSEKQAFDLEINLIQIYGRQDMGTGCLCNHTNGGEGTGISGYYGPATLDRRLSLSKPRRQQGRENIRKGKRIQAGISIESFNLRTGELIKRYECQQDAKLDGFHPENIRAALSGRRKQAHGLGWKYTPQLKVFNG